MNDDVNHGLIRLEYLMLLKSRHNEMYLDCIKLYLEYRKDYDESKLRLLRSNWRVLKDYRYKIDKHIQQDKLMNADGPDGFTITANFMKLFAESPQKIDTPPPSTVQHNTQDGQDRTLL